MSGDARSKSGYAGDLQVLCGLGGIGDTVLQGIKDVRETGATAVKASWGMWERNALRTAVNSIYGPWNTVLN